MTTTLTLARVERASLVAALALFKVPGAGIIERKNTIPVLNCIRFDFGNDRLTLRGTDLDIGLAVELPADCESPRSFVLEFEPLRAAVAKSKADHVEFEDVGGAVLVRQAGAVMRMAYGAPVADWAETPILWGALEGAECFAMDAKALAADLARCQPCVSTEVTRYYLNGVFFHRVGDELRMAATDGHRLARIIRPAPVGMPAAFPDVILPRKASAFLARALAKHDGDVTIGFTASKCIFRFGRVVFRSKLIDGTFPDYARVIPAHDQRRLSVDASGLASAIDQATAHMGNGRKCVNLMIDGEAMAARGYDPETGTVEVPFLGTYDADDGSEDFHLAFNGAMARDILGAFKGSPVTFGIADASCPIRIESVDAPGVTFVLMPMKSDAPTKAVDETALDVLHAKAPGLIVAGKEGTLARQARCELGRIAQEAIAYVQARDNVARPVARLVVLMALAVHGDEVERAEQLAQVKRCLAEPRGSFAAHVAAERELMKETKPAPAEPDKPQPMPSPGESAPVPAPEPVDEGPALYPHLQAFKAAAGVGTRWQATNWASAAGTWGEPRVLTVVTQRARSLGFMRGEASAADIAEWGDKPGGAGRTWIGMPKQGEWRSDGEGLIMIYPDGSPCMRLDPLPALEAPQETVQPSGEVEALRDAVAALTARLEALETAQGQVAPPEPVEEPQEAPEPVEEAGDAVEERATPLVKRLARTVAQQAARIARLVAIVARRKAEVKALRMELGRTRGEAARYRRAYGELLAANGMADPLQPLEAVETEAA